MCSSRIQGFALFLAMTLTGASASAQSDPYEEAAPPSSAVPTVIPAREAARPLAAAGLTAYDAGQFVEAIAQFRGADAMYPAPQYRVYIARAHKHLGQVASAARAYEAAVGMPPPPDAGTGFLEAQSLAAAELQEIRPRIPAIQFQIMGPAPLAVLVTVDGATVPASAWASIELDPGPHTLSASAPGFRSVTLPVEAMESQVARVALVLEPEATSPAASAGPRLSDGLTGSARRDLPMDASPPPLSHRWRPGIVLRGDIDPVRGGMLFAPGVSFGVLDRLELVMSVLIGRDGGFEPALRGFILTGAWKPLIEVAAPMFIVGGVHAGFRASAGLQWDFHRHLGAHISLGGAYFPEPPDGYETAYFLPSIGVQGRL